jgi:S1-C subfamily serine protease
VPNGGTRPALDHDHEVLLKVLLRGFLLAVLLSPAAAAAVPGAIEESVVRIFNHSQRADWSAPWNLGPAQEETGSGFVVAGGRVMTNAHVVSDSRMCVLFLHNDPAPHPARVSVIGHDCDLALLEPLEKGLLDGTPPLEFGGLPRLRSTVETYGYPRGGKTLSSTRGVVSRIEVQPYVHSGLDSHLTVQTDAAINPGNSGGPVVQEGRVVGVAFQGFSRLENVGFFIPAEVVRHFLEDAADGSYDGYPELGVLTESLENPAARRAAGLADDESGVSVFLVLPESSADGTLREGDVVLSVEGAPVANDGTVELEGLRLEFGVLADRLQVGDTLSLQVLRDGARLDVSVPLRSYRPHQRFANRYDHLPRYYVYAGLVFVPLDREVLKTFGHGWARKAGKPLLHEFFFRFLEEPRRILDEPVVLIRRLDHAVNANFAWRPPQLLERVNGREIRRLEDVAAALDGGAGRYDVFEFSGAGGLDVLDRRAAREAHDGILATYGLTEDRRL